MTTANTCIILSLGPLGSNEWGALALLRDFGLDPSLATLYKPTTKFRQGYKV